MQRAAVSRASAARDERIGTWFEEKASGAQLARPELSRLRAAVRAGKVRTLYVYKLDRLTRSGIRDTLALLEELRGGGCLVRTASGELPDFDGPFGEVLVAILAWAAQVERSLIRDRQAAARERMEANGEAWGRPRRLTEERAAWFRRELKRGRSARELAESTGVSESTIRRTRRR